MTQITLSKEEKNILLKALKEYEERHYNILCDYEQETINKFIEKVI